MGSPITIIEASGDAKQRGTSIGKAVAQSVHDAVVTQSEFSEALELFQGSDYVKALHNAAEGAYPEYMQELVAMAEAIEIEPAKLFIWNCRGDLRFPPETAQSRLDSLTDGCTTILAPQSANDVPAIIAHNEDGDAGFMAHKYWLKANPDNAPAFESYLYPGMLAGHSFGVNAAGLVQTINNIRPDDMKPGIPRHFVCRAIMASETLQQAVSHLQRTDRASGFHHSIGFPGMEAPASIEAPASGMVLRNVSTPQAHANHLLDDYFTKVDQVITDSSAYRQGTAAQYLADGGDPTSPEDILFQRGANNGLSVLRRPDDGGDDYGYTLATGVFKLFADRVEWAVHGSPDDLNTLTGSFET